jgi:hypothetical protein
MFITIPAKADKAVIRVDAIDSVYDSGTEQNPTYTLSLRNGDKFTSDGTAEGFVAEYVDKAHAPKKGKASH